MGTNISWDPSDLEAKATKLIEVMTQRRNVGVHAIATEIMRLSQREVPLDKGELAKSGHLQPDAPAEEIIVGYNKPYAAFQHEGVRADGSHTVTHWQNGRKKKYLEDPIKNNLETLKGYFAAAIKGGGSGGAQI